jgi:hypothetical protein
MTTFYATLYRIVRFFTTNGAIIFFRLELLNTVLFSVLLSNPFARLFSAVPRGSAILPYAVILPFAMQLKHAARRDF